MGVASMLPDFDQLFDRPVIVLAAPRSGSTLLFETLAECRDVWTIGSESHQIIESLPALNPNSGRVNSNRLEAAHATEPVVNTLRRRFARFLRDRDGLEYFRNPVLPRLRFLEKTPKNALRVPFMERVFPGALYVFLFRDVRTNLSSMMEAWKSQRWVTYPRLRGWRGPPWSLLLPPGWETLDGNAVPEICAFQWKSANDIILSDLESVPRERWTCVSYESLLRDPRHVIEGLCTFAGLEFDQRLAARVGKPLPLSRLTQTPPDADKWRKNEGDIRSVLPQLEATEARLAPHGYRRAG